MSTLKNSRRIASAAIFAAAALSVPLAAQEPVEAAMCTATIEPATVQIGQKAVQVTVALSENLGGVTGVNTEMGTGIALASPADLPRTDMAATATAPVPIEMGTAQNSWNVWLNTAEAEAGQYELTFVTEQGACTAELAVEGSF